MALALYFHPLASFCHKVLIALYETETAFEPRLVDLSQPDASAGLLALWPVGKIPVLHDEEHDRVIPESTVIIEYLDRHSPGRQRLFPEDEDERLEARLWDRFFDLYVQMPMQKIVTDRLRPEAERDRRGVAEASSALALAYDMIDGRLARRCWVVGNHFGIADCAAAPALFFAAIVAPFGSSQRHLSAYFERLLERASVRRVITEARPYFDLFPFRHAMPARFL